MNEKVARTLALEVATGSQAYVRNLTAAERAILRGQFNVAKVLRAAAHAQRTWAMNAARLLERGLDPADLLAGILGELEQGLEADEALVEAQQQSATARQRLIGILQRSMDSLAENPDVLERDVPLSLMGCYQDGNVIEGYREACDLCGALSTELVGCRLGGGRLETTRNDGRSGQRGLCLECSGPGGGRPGPLCRRAGGL